MNEAQPRYVILQHVLPDGQHWDLMLDQGQALATWQLAGDPASLAPQDSRGAIPARHIADHRRAYLEYEGPVSGQRGHVKRVEEGTYELMECSAAGWRVRLDGRLLKGLFFICIQTDDASGTFQRSGV